MTTETERLVLRKPEMSDAEDIFLNYARDPDVTRYLPWPAHNSIDVTKEWLQGKLPEWDENKNIFFAIVLKETGSVIGMCEFRINNFKADFGYVLAKKYWNRGIMTEAMKPLVEMLLKREGMYRIQAFHDIANPASGKVMQKLGMQFEGILRKYMLHPGSSGIPRDVSMYSIVKE
ncbi:MAG: GNAT family N-acetyltransferase [Spirochaetales bacterium]|nr:GNAT family N-acetyltransferase [Spirochaetales bacterium]